MAWFRPAMEFLALARCLQHRKRADIRNVLPGLWRTCRLESEPQRMIPSMSTLQSKYQAVRSMTRSLVAPLSAEDQMVQSCPEASPVKWHQAHTTWFFETFVLRPYLCDYNPFHEDFHWLFNSSYISLDEEIAEKKQSASFSRPSLEQVLDFRAHVDHQMLKLFARTIDQDMARRILLGLNHEQQHQELALTDIKHAFFSNPLRPAYHSSPLADEYGHPLPKLCWY